MPRSTELLGLSTIALAAWVAVACSSDDGDDKVGGLGAQSSGASAGVGHGGSSASSSTGGASSSTGGTTPIVVMGGSSSGATGGTIAVDPQAGAGGQTPGNGTPEVCDGVDNDQNGIVDDVDLGHDGVCDCLNIGTIGQIGPWSTGGNIFAEWLDARSPLGAVALDDQVLTPAVLSPLQVIVVLHVDETAISNGSLMAAAHHAFSDDEATAFGDWVKHGGGVMTTIGYTGNESAEVVNVNRLLGTVGMGYSTTDIDLSGFVTEWMAHPVTMGVSNIFTDNGVEPDSAGGTTVARGADGRIALQVSEAEAGHVVVWGDEWITYDSEWVDVENQQVETFWLNILKWLSPPKTCQVPIPPPRVR